MSGLSNAYADTGLRKPTFAMIPPYHPYSPETGGVVNNSYAVFAIPMPKDHRLNKDTVVNGPYGQNATSWNRLNPRFQHSDKFKTMLHLFTHAFEFKNEGCPTFNGIPGSDQVRATMAAYVRSLTGRRHKGDNELLKPRKGSKGIRFTHHMDQAVAEAFRELVSGKYNDRIPGWSNAGELGANDIMDGMETRGVYRDEELDRRRGNWNRQQPDEDLDGDEAEDQAILDILDELLRDHEGMDVMEKVKVLVVNMTRPMLDDNGEQMFRPVEDPNTGMYVRNRETGQVLTQPAVEDAGCVIFFLVMDPLYSVGSAVENIINMAEHHALLRQGIGGRDDMRGAADSNDGGNRRYGGGASGNAVVSDLVKNFPWITSEDHTDNALLTLDKDRYLDLVAFIRDDETIKTTRRAQLLARTMGSAGTDRNPNEIHPLNVFTVEYALDVMHKFGVPREQCRMERFRGENYLFDDGADGLAFWQFPPEQTYHYELSSWMWFRNGKAALKLQYFPWVDIPDILEQLTNVVSDSNALTVYEGDTETNVLGKNYTRECIIPGVGPIMPMQNMPYDPFSILRQNDIFRVAIENRQLLDSVCAPRDPERNPEEYEAYCIQIGRLREACMIRMEEVMIPGAHIPKPFKIILTFLAQKVRRVSTFLPQYTMDPFEELVVVYPLDPFANYLIREALYVRHYRFIVSEVSHWQITHHGTQDCYAMMDVDIHYCSIYHGLSQGGKSFFCKDATAKTMVPGTVQQILESSTRAFNTHDDFVGNIIFKDEVEDIYVSAKAAERDRTGAAERIKSMMTDQKCTYRVLTFMDQANGRTKRVAEDIETLYHATMAACTNKKVNKGEEAISSRFLNFTINRADVDLYDFLGIKEKLDDQDKQRNNDFVHMLRVKQCLTAVAQALMDAGVITPPSMDVFDVMNAHVLSYLKDQGVDTSAIRGAQMVKRLARIYTILNAIIQLYDVPGAKFADADYEITQLSHLTPYNYCTKQIFLMSLTQTAEIYIHPMQIVVLKGLFKYTHFPYKRDKEIQDYFREDLCKNIRWRRIKERNGDETIDFNYVTVPGNYRDVVLKNLAENCDPKIGENEVDAELSALCKQSITVFPAKTINAVHYDEDLNKAAIRSYTLPRETKKVRLPVVIRNFAENEIYVAVEALNHYKEDIMLNAFLNCIHDGFRPQTFLVGTQLRACPECPGKCTVEAHSEHTYSGVYQTLEVNPLTIRQYSMGPQFGIPDAAYVPSTIADMLGGSRLHPDKKNETYSQERIKRTRPVVGIAEDLDDWGHKLHFYRSGLMGDYQKCPGRQTNIYRRMRAYLLERESEAERNGPEHECALMVDYPAELKKAEDERLKHVARARNFSGARQHFHDTHQQDLKRYELLSAEERRAIPKPQEFSPADFKPGGKFANFRELPEEIIKFFNEGAEMPEPSRALVPQRALARRQKRIQNVTLEFVSSRFDSARPQDPASVPAVTVGGNDDEQAVTEYEPPGDAHNKRQRHEGGADRSQKRGRRKIIQSSSRNLVLEGEA